MFSQKFRKIHRKNTCARICKFIKKETLAQMFSCEFCEISKNTFFTDHLWSTVSRAGARLNFLQAISVRMFHFFSFSFRVFKCLSITKNTTERFIKGSYIAILKLVSSIFIYFTKREHLKNYEKHFLFCQKKKSFCSPDIQIFILSSLFPCQSLLNIQQSLIQENPKLYDIILCLSKNLKKTSLIF